LSSNRDRCRSLAYACSWSMLQAGIPGVNISYQRWRSESYGLRTFPASRKVEQSLVVAQARGPSNGDFFSCLPCAMLSSPLWHLWAAFAGILREESATEIAFKAQGLAVSSGR
jgi:hypothetical protein